MLKTARSIGIRFRQAGLLQQTTQDQTTMDPHDEKEPLHSPQERALTHRTLIIIGIAVSAVVALALLWYLIDVLLLVFAGVLLAVIIRTPAGWLSTHTPLPSGWALALVIFTVFGLIGVSGFLFGQTAADQLVQLIRKLPETAGSLRDRLTQYEWGQLLVQQIRPRELLAAGPEFMGRGIAVISTTFGIIANLVIVLVIGIYLAAQPRIYIHGLVQLVPLHRRQRAGELLAAVGHILRWWLLGQLSLMVVIATATGVGLWLLGVPLWLALALLAGLLEFIPYIGPILAAVPAILVAFGESTILAGYVALLYIGVQTLESYLLTPLIQRKAVYLPPAVIIFAQVVLGVLVGGLGLALATPLAAATMVTVKMLYIEDVLGDRGKGT